MALWREKFIPWDFRHFLALTGGSHSGSNPNPRSPLQFQNSGWNFFPAKRTPNPSGFVFPAGFWARLKNRNVPGIQFLPPAVGSGAVSPNPPRFFGISMDLEMGMGSCHLPN